MRSDSPERVQRLVIDADMDLQRQTGAMERFWHAVHDKVMSSQDHLTGVKPSLACVVMQRDHSEDMPGQVPLLLALTNFPLALPTEQMWSDIRGLEYELVPVDLVEGEIHL